MLGALAGGELGEDGHDAAAVGFEEIVTHPVMKLRKGQRIQSQNDECLA